MLIQGNPACSNMEISPAVIGLKDYDLIVVVVGEFYYCNKSCLLQLSTTGGRPTRNGSQQQFSLFVYLIAKGVE